MISKEKFLSLQGKWALKRSTNGFGNMQGVAVFSPFVGQYPSLLYREEGTFFTPQEGLFDFYRDYIYFLNDKQIDVYFVSVSKKQDLFLSLTPSSTNRSATGSHMCKEDLYVATYQFLDSDTFTLYYEIKGPKKDLIIETLFERVHLS